VVHLFNLDVSQKTTVLVRLGHDHSLLNGDACYIATIKWFLDDNRSPITDHWLPITDY
jgi:hypothetical protein